MDRGHAENLKEAAETASEAVGLGSIPFGNSGAPGSATTTDDQLSVEFRIENLLLALPRRQNWVPGDVGSCRLPMTNRREPGRVRGQNGRAVLIGCCSRRMK